MNISQRASALLGLTILLWGFYALCYQVVWQRVRVHLVLGMLQRPRVGAWVTSREGQDSPRFNDYWRSVPVISPSEP